MKRLLTLFTAVVMMALAVPAAHAQSDYPNKPIKLIVPFRRGTSDVMGRMIAEELTKSLKQPVLVENVGGAGGVIGTERGAKSAPDGYTLVQTGVGQSAVAHGLNPKLGYDSMRDFIHISQVHSGPNLLVVHPDTPFKTFKELIDYGRANPGKLNYGFTHAASGHMAMELLKQTVSECPKGTKDCKGLFMVGIPYRGGGPMMTDMLGGQIPMMFINQDVALQHVRAGELRALAVSSKQRNPLYPDVPTISELGYPGFEALSWSGLSVPRGTPQPIVDKIEAAMTAAMQSPAIKQRMESVGFVIPPQGSKAYTAFVKSELDNWTRVIKVAGIKPSEPRRSGAVATAMLIAILLAQIGFGLLAMTICLPSMQEWGAIFGASQAQVQLSFSAYVVAYGLMQLVYGPLSDRFGRKSLLMTGLAVACVGSTLAALAPTLPLLIAARLVQGAGAAAGMVIGRSLVQDFFVGPQRTRVMAYFGMVLGLCPPLATIVGGQLHVRLGWQANFVLTATVALALLLTAWRGLPDSTRKPAAPAPTTDGSHWLADIGKAYARLAAEGRFRLYVLVMAMTSASFATFLAGAPIVLASYGVGPQGVGFYIMAVPLSYVVGNFGTSRLIGRLGERRMMQLGQVASVSGLVLVVTLGLAGAKSAWAFALPLVLLGLGHGFLMPPALAGTLGVMPALAGTAAAMAGVSQQLTGALGGYLVGLVRHDGAVNLGLLMLAFTLCAVGAQWVLQRR